VSSAGKTHIVFTASSYSSLSRRRFPERMNARQQQVEVVVPVHNEEATVEPNTELLLAYLLSEFPFHFAITIADTASGDRTPVIARELAANYDEVAYLRLEQGGRGMALRRAWLESDADVVSYMDVDLSTNLESFLPLVAPIMSGHSELAIGTRFAYQAHVHKHVKREILSRGYNTLVHLLFNVGFSDAQCGFKVVRGDIARRLVPLIRDDGWFFDTELLLLAERNGMRIHEVPVDWIEDLDLRVDLVSTIAGGLGGLWRVRRSFWHGEGRLPTEPSVVVAGTERMLEA
jgi:glycosyltransferase involved in cell wall biosynthesis